MISAIGNVVLLAVGYVASLCFRRVRGEAAADEMTLPGWLARKRKAAAHA